jgi:hypothetical protein
LVLSPPTKAAAPFHTDQNRIHNNKLPNINVMTMGEDASSVTTDQPAVAAAIALLKETSYFANAPAALLQELAGTYRT